MRMKIEKTAMGRGKIQQRGDSKERKEGREK